MYSNTALLTLPRVGQVCRWMSSFLMVALNDSAIALSKQMPVFPTDGIIPFASARFRNLWLVYWLPRAEWMTAWPMAGRRLSTAIVSASVTNSVRMCPAIAQPTILLVNPSIIEERYAPPLHVRTDGVS